MYSWVDGRRSLDSKNLPAVFTSKNYVPLIKNPFDVNNFKRLPVIKEEEGYISDDEVQVSGNLRSSNLMKKPNGSNLKIDTSNVCKPATKLPPLININCMMNMELKQASSIWNTKFGRRLISSKNTDEEMKTIPPGSKKIRPNSVKNCSEKFGDYQESKALPKRKTVRAQTTKANKEDGTENRIKKKSKSVNKNKQSFKKKPNQEKVLAKKSVSVTGVKSAETFSETPLRELPESCPTVSLFTKNQRFLAECVQSILDGEFDKINCDHCDESFQNVQELCSHKKQHETEKEGCLLCGKEFYNPNEFIQHLLTHEGVDKYSCKKCKKYFPNLQKYKQHRMYYHLTPSEATCQTQTSVESMRKWFTKFECKRCKIEFKTEKEQEAHRRDHIKNDLAGAYLLSPKNEY